MGKNTLVRGIAAGAIIGGLITLFDRDTRGYVGQKIKSCGDKTSFYVKNPADAMHQLNTQYTRYSQQFSANLTSALHMLDQIREIADKVDLEQRDKE
ncbi:hypothetical protein MUN88_01655 [Gracilibacillus caseinilyticus]|uniref:Gas vesicle protein n=1 Tax=Gracilibacillus caseinilyticus TaxID=2932256 RepID=A0ABY4EXV9_9BACI|nr:hypothetical protein [Gracilibacillus caseinilyticus]UOQ48871.1 hypothetical protein MUN88_01655 [Gracilibacillus caseinilyticus]